MSIAKPMTEGEPGIIVGSLSDASSDSPPRMALSAASSDIQSRQSSESPNRNPNPNPGIPDASSDIQSRQSDPSPMAKRGKRGRSEEADQMEPKTKKSSSTSTIPKGLEHIPEPVFRPFPLTPLKEGTTYLCYFPEDPNYKYFPKGFHVPPPHLVPRPNTPPPSPPVQTNIKCYICGGDHGTPLCSYLAEIPQNQNILEDNDFQIVCECSWPIVKGVCSSGRCPSNRKRKVVPNYTPLFDPSKRDPVMESCGATRRLIPANQIQ